MDRRHVGPSEPSAAKLPFVGVEHVAANSGVINFDSNSRVGDQRSTTFRFDGRHVLYGKLRPYLNKVATPDFAGRCSTELIPLLPQAGVDRDFLAYLLRRRETVEFAMASVTGSRMPRTDMNFLLSMQVPLPPLDEQQRIVAILNRASRIELLRARAAERLREFVPALFVKMFGDPIVNPMRWFVEQLGRMIDKGPQNGLYMPKSHYGSGTPILRIDGFYGGEVVDPETWQRVRLDEPTVKKYQLTEGDIVINRVNSRPFVGKSAIIPQIKEPTVFESNMMRLRVDAGRIRPDFLISMLQIDSVRGKLRVNAKDAINQSSINQADVRQLPVIVPPLQLQRRFADTVRSIQAQDGPRRAGGLSSLLTESLAHRFLGDH
ncbi:MAG: hypothetical protein F4220_14465 [Gammaproteobacteria bacterium]|nr:hypothetical protein [Gammaproteobacteria bacterium]